VAVNCISVEILEINNEDANISPLCKSLFFNTKRYVAVSNIKLGSRDFEEIEENGYENCIFKYKKEDIELKCTILSKVIKKIKEGVISEAKKSLKRSEHSEYAMNSQKSKSSVVITKQTQSNVTQTSSISQASNNSTSIKSFEDKNKLNVTTQLSQDSNSDRISRTNNDDILKQELDLNELLTLADNDEFPKKEYIINKKIKYYCQMLHFYKSIRIFKKLPESNERLEYECKICKEVFLSPFTDKSDLYKHLNLHKEYKKWNEKYKNYKKIKVEPIIDADTMLLVKYFVT
jgi:hypothetical protein